MPEGKVQFMERAQIASAQDVERMIKRISHEIVERNHGTENVAIVGLATGGLFFAELLAENLSSITENEIPFGVLDIAPYRDDSTFDASETENEIENKTENTVLDFDVNEKRIILVDDVIFTGRSARAGINAVMDRGRPAAIQLGVLVDRGHRELPIRADYVGKNIPTRRSEHIQCSKESGVWLGDVY